MLSWNTCPGHEMIEASAAVIIQDELEYVGQSDDDHWDAHDC